MDIENKERKSKIAVIIAVILTFFAGATGMYLVIKYVPLDLASITNITKTEKEVTVNENGIADAVDKVYDSVVTVETYKSKKKISSGTGFIYKTVDDKAYVLTNNHVIDGGDDIKLVFTNDTTIDAKVLGSDSYADIAVLEISKNDIISVAELGSSTDIRIGDTVFAVGAPLDNAYSWTVTRGIVSGKDRMVEVSLTSNSNSTDWIMKVIQTDAAINSGNSGGPLSNSNGEVIGITSLKLVSSGVEGMGFAIPIEDALEYAEKIEKGEKTIRPYIGITMVELNDIENLYRAGITVDTNITSGVAIVETVKNSPAAKAELQKGDVITEIAGHKVSSVAELRYYLYKNNAGDTIDVKIIRDSKEQTVKVKLVASES